MNGRQLAMDEALADLDRYELEREKRETDAIRARLDEKYKRLDRRACDRGEIPAGTVVIIGQEVFRNNHSTLHFYRTVLDYHWSTHSPTTPHFVEAQTEEWPDVPPWAKTVNHEGEARDIGLHSGLTYWDTGEVIDPIKTWWEKEWDGMKMNK